MIKKILLFSLVFILIVMVACKPNSTESKQVEQETTTQEIALDETEIIETSKELDYFVSRDEIEISNHEDSCVSMVNEVILFRPTEHSFGQLLEDTQSEEWVTVDANFEALSNTLMSHFKQRNEVSISICEKPLIRIPQSKDTLYFDTSKFKYGMIFCSAGQRPIFKKATEKNVLEQIKSIYKL